MTKSLENGRKGGQPAMRNTTDRSRKRGRLRASSCS